VLGSCCRFQGSVDFFFPLPIKCIEAELIVQDVPLKLFTLG
jgi:hypothetical protein